MRRVLEYTSPRCMYMGTRGLGVEGLGFRVGRERKREKGSRRLIVVVWVCVVRAKNR